MEPLDFNMYLEAPVNSNGGSDPFTTLLTSINGTSKNPPHNKHTLNKAMPTITKVYNGLRSRGLSSHEACGILGNILAENTTFNPNLSNGSYVGLVQLSPVLQNYIKKNYGSVNNLENQLNFIADWSKGKVYTKDPSNAGYGYASYRGKGRDAASYAKAWSDHFERHGGSSTLRQRYANAFYKYFNR